MNGLYIAKNAPLVVLMDSAETGKLLYDRLAGKCSILCCPASDWNREMTPWEAPALNQGQRFGGGAESFLASVLKAVESAVAELPEAPTDVYLMGYSLGGLFALWAGTRTDVFSGVASVSGSLWYDGFTDYLAANPCLARRVYLSLGEKEPNARDARMQTVGERTLRAEAILREQGREVVFRWNNGGHFTEPIKRMDDALRWLIGG